MPSESVADASAALSPVQQGMYFHHLRRKNSVYMEQMICEIVGALDPDLAERTLNQLVLHHEALRTVFVSDSREGARQRTFPYRPRRLRYKDLSADGQGFDFLRSRIRSEMRRNFDLTQEATRCELIRVSENRFVFLWTYHHLIMDALSIRLLQSEFCRIYLDLSQGREASPATALPYRNYVEWLSAQSKEEALAYWSRYLTAYESAALVWPAAEDIEARTARVDFGAETAESLRRIGRRSRATANAVFLAAWGSYLLHRLDRSEVLFGCVVSGRMIRLRDVDKICGLFVNAIPVRLGHGASVIEAVTSLQHHLLTAGPYAHVALSDVMRSGNLDVGNVITVVNFSVDDVNLDNDDIRRLPFAIEDIHYNERAHYPVYLDVYLTPDDLSVAIHHDPALFKVDPGEVRQTIGHILDLFARSGDLALSEILAERLESPISVDAVLHF
jgi:hypothetical protein